MNKIESENRDEYLTLAVTHQPAPFLMKSKETKLVIESENEPELYRVPPMFLRERSPEGRFDAVSGMTLVGVAWRSANHELGGVNDHPEASSLENGFRSLLASIQSHQDINVVTTRRQNGTVEWKIVSSIQSTNLEEARSKSSRFWQNVNVVADGLLPCYRFDPITIESQFYLGGDLPFVTRLSSGGVSLPIFTPSKIGFVATSANHNLGNKVLIVPYDIGVVAAPAAFAIREIERANQVIEFTLSFRRVELSSADRRLAARALDWLRNDSQKEIRYEEHVSIAHEPTLESLCKELEGWCRNPRGYALSCIMRSDRPIPQALIHSICREIFPGRPFRVMYETANTEDLVSQSAIEHDDHALDLRDTFNASASLPSVLPDPSALRELGIGKFYPAPTFALSRDGALLGRLESEGRQVDVRLPRRDRECHIALIGATGAGKSTALASLIEHSIQSNEGVVLLDPHGQLYEQALQCIPESRSDDVVLIDFTDFDHSVGINFLECRGAHNRMQMNFITNEMIKILDRLYDLRQTGGPMFETYMRNALLLIMDNDVEGGTLVDVPLIFEDKEFRKFLLDHCQNPYVKSFWTKQAEAASGEASMANIAPYITSKLNQFTNNSLVRGVIGQTRSTINFREIVDQGKILIVNLSKGQLSQLDTQLLGMLVMGKLFGAAMERGAANSLKPKRTFLYIDEFANFATDTAAFMLSESRKFGLHMTIAFQNLAQLSAHDGKQNLLDSLLANIASMILFRIGPMDAEKLASYMRPDFEAGDLQDLPNHHAVARLLIDNHPQPPFVFKTVPIMTSKSRNDVDRIVQMARAKYTVQADRVEEELLRRRRDYASLVNDEGDSDYQEIA